MGVNEELLEAVNRNVRPFLLSDSGDNTTAGAPMDLTIVLQAALERSDQCLITVTGVIAPEAVRACLSLGAGQKVTLDLGSEYVSGPRKVKRAVGTVEEANPGLRVQGFQPLSQHRGTLGQSTFRQCDRHISQSKNRNDYSGPFSGVRD
jgi:microcystin degradation protein MlrC